jgi:hypothetical protein
MFHIAKVYIQGVCHSLFTFKRLNLSSLNFNCPAYNFSARTAQKTLFLGTDRTENTAPLFLCLYFASSHRRGPRRKHCSMLLFNYCFADCQKTPFLSCCLWPLTDNSRYTIAYLIVAT